MSRRVALVTGGGTGVGRASALALARAGFDLVLAGRREGPLGDVASEIQAIGADAISAIGNIADEADVAAIFGAARTHFGRLDLLFNNAGVTAPGTPIEDTPLDVWQQVIGINLTGAFLCTREAIRMFKAQQPRGGRIINNGSLSAHVPRVNSSAYTASKHAITGLTKSTALEGRPFDIACGQIDIGNAETPMNDRGGAGLPQPDGTSIVEPKIDAGLVADAVVYMAGLPLGANVLTLTVMATGMPYVGRG